MTNGVFSEFEILEQYIKVGDEASFATMSCVGSSEEELEARTVTKKCRGSIVKTKTKGTGNGTLKESLHVPAEIYNKIYDMTHDDLATGVRSYGQTSRHPEVSITQRVLDEDGEEKLKAYPRAVLQTGPKRKIENGQEEVPELELEFQLLPDDRGDCMYDALVSDIDDTIKESWLTGFSLDLVKKNA